jgi:hypothetical protein
MWVVNVEKPSLTRRCSVAEIDVEGLAGCEIKECFGLLARPCQCAYKCDPAGEVKEAGCDTRGYGTWDTGRREHDGPPCCGGSGAGEPKKESGPEVTLGRSYEGGDVLRLV